MYCYLQNVVILHYLPDLLHKHRALATARKALVQQGVVALSQGQCLISLLQQLPTLLQEQYQYEKVIAKLGLHSLNV